MNAMLLADDDYHEAFWATLGGAAAAMLVAMVVLVGLLGRLSMQQMLRPPSEFNRAPEDFRTPDDVEEAAFADYKAFLGSRLVKRFIRGVAFSYVLQAAILFMSLWSLATTQDIVPPWLGAVLQAVALVGLSYTAFTAERAKSATTPGGRLRRHR